MLLNRFSLIVLGFIFFTCLGCSSTHPDIEKNAQKNAKEFCKCAKDGAELMQKIKKTKDDTEIDALAKESIKKYKDMNKCLNDELSINKHEKFMKSLNEKEAKLFTSIYNKHIISNCPEIAKAYDIK